MNTNQPSSPSTEAQRQQAERGRERAEGHREAAEESREKAEELRSLAEELRQTREEMRQYAESARLTVEMVRVLHENARQTAVERWSQAGELRQVYDTVCHHSQQVVDTLRQVTQEQGQILAKIEQIFHMMAQWRHTPEDERLYRTDT
jgi:hypothetical protein